MFVNLADAITLLSKLTPKRLLNVWRIFSSYLISRFFRKDVMSGLPISLAIEPTTACNLGCPECPSGLKMFSRPTGRLQPTLFKQIIDELSPYTSYLTFYFQGEPFLNPDFLDMVGYAADQDMYTATSTNAHFLDSEQARRTVQSAARRRL